MLTIAKLFGKSPFAPLQGHMDKVVACTSLLPRLFDALVSGEKDKIDSLRKEISHLEHEADLVKREIRNQLPKSLFLPVDRSQLLEIISLQDAIADKAEDIATLATLKNLNLPNELDPFFLPFCEKNVEATLLVHLIIKELEALIESSFGGLEATKVQEMVDRLGLHEHEVDLMQYDILKTLYSLSDTMPYASFHLWMSLIKEIGTLSNLAEKLGYRIRMILDMPHGH
jgi:uncharacterized protein